MYAFLLFPAINLNFVIFLQKSCRKYSSINWENNISNKDLTFNAYVSDDLR